MSKNTARNEARREAKEAKKILAALLIAPDTENYQTLPNLNPDNICPIGPTCCCLDNDCLDRSLQETDFLYINIVVNMRDRANLQQLIKYNIIYS